MSLKGSLEKVLKSHKYTVYHSVMQQGGTKKMKLGHRKTQEVTVGQQQLYKR